MISLPDSSRCPSRAARIKRSSSGSFRARRCMHAGSTGFKVSMQEACKMWRTPSSRRGGRSRQHPVRDGVTHWPVGPFSLFTAAAVIRFTRQRLASPVILKTVKGGFRVQRGTRRRTLITLTPEQQQDVARRFQGLATQWKATARYRSNTHALRNQPIFQELVALGEPVVPLILTELARESNVSWFTLLAAITGEDPVPLALAGRVDDMAQAWLDWGRHRGYVV